MPDLMRDLQIRPLIGRKSEWRLSDADDFHPSGTQLAHSNSPYPAFRSEVNLLNFPVCRKSVEDRGTRIPATTEGQLRLRNAFGF